MCFIKIVTISDNIVFYVIELIKYNGGIHIKISPEQQNLHEFTMNILYRDKIFSLYDKNPDLNIDLPTPQIEVMHFCSMILQQKLDFPK